MKKKMDLFDFFVGFSFNWFNILTLRGTLDKYCNNCTVSWGFFKKWEISNRRNLKERYLEVFFKSERNLKVLFKRGEKSSYPLSWLFWVWTMACISCGIYILLLMKNEIDFTDLFNTFREPSQPSKHTTLFWRPSNVHKVQKTLNRRPNNVLYLNRGNYFEI